MNRTRTRTRTLALAVSVAASLALAACGSSGSSGNASAGYGATATTTAANTTNARAVGPPTTQPAGSPGMSSGSAAEIEVVHDAKLGDLLATSDGHTLYRFEQDHGTSSACSGPCLDAWPPVTSDAPQAGKGVTGKLTSVDGAAAHQVAIDGHLLYTYAGDQAPGAVNGTSIPDWYAVAPDGSTIEH